MNSPKRAILRSVAMPELGGLGEIVSRSSDASQSRHTEPCVSAATRNPRSCREPTSAPRWCSAGLPPLRVTHRGAPAEFLEAPDDRVVGKALGRRPHDRGVDGVHRVAPRAAVVAAAEADEVRRQPCLRTLALDRRPEDLDDRVSADTRSRLNLLSDERGHAARALGMYGAGSVTPFCSKPRKRSTHASHSPHASPASDGS